MRGSLYHRFSQLNHLGLGPSIGATIASETRGFRAANYSVKMRGGVYLPSMAYVNLTLTLQPAERAVISITCNQSNLEAQRWRYKKIHTSMKFYGDENELCYSDAEDSHKPSGSSYTGGIGEFGQGHQSKNL